MLGLGLEGCGLGLGLDHILVIVELPRTVARLRNGSQII